MILAFSLAFAGCGASDGANSATSQAAIQNDFNNPEMAFQPPWTICESSYLGVEFGKLGTGQTSALHAVSPGLDYVLMVAAWNDPACSAAHALPIASKNEEELVAGQTRTIAINLANHQGACPPEGVAPIPQEQYERILQLWPDYGFLPYAQRTSNPQCAPAVDGDAGVDAE